MPNVIYAEGNYIVVDTTGTPELKPKVDWLYFEDDTALYLAHRPNIETPVRILKSDAGDWEDDSAVNYSESTLRDFLTANSGYIPTDSFSFGNAIQFDGLDDFVSFPTITEMNSATKFSIHMWIESSSGEIAVAGYASTTSNRFGVMKFSDDNIYFFVNGGIGNVSYASKLGSKTLVSLVYDNAAGGTNATKLKAFLDSAQQTLSFTGTVATALNSAAGDAFELNRYALASAIGDAKVTQISIVNGATPVSEIEQLWNGGNGAEPSEVLSNLLEVWKINESDGATTIVGSQGNYNGTITNASTPPAYIVTW